MDLNNNPLFLTSRSINSATEAKVECKICKKALFPELLKKHMRIFHKILFKKTNNKKLKLLGDGRVKCRICKKKLCNLQYAKIHYKNVHILKKVIDREMVKCDYSVLFSAA